MGTADTDDPTVVLSPYRPLTRGARDDLEEYGIITVADSCEPNGPESVVQLEERPPRDLLEQHELILDRDPERVYETDDGSLVEIYDDRVVNNGVEATLDPEEATERAEAADWDRRSDLEA